MQIRRRIKCNLFFILLFVCMAALVFSYVGLLNASDNGTLYIKDIIGNRAILEDVVISGIIQDRYHGIEFDIENDDVSQKFVYYDSFQDIREPGYKLVNTLQDGEAKYIYQLEYEISDDANVEIVETKETLESGYSITKTKKADKIDFYVYISVLKNNKSNLSWDRIRYRTGASLISGTKDFQFGSTSYYDENGNLLAYSETSQKIGEGPYTAGSDTSNAFTLLDGCLYFTFFSSPYHTGSNGIFKVEDFSDSWPGDSPYEKKEYGNVKPVAVFSLDDNSLSVLGLKAVNGRLILIVIENDMLVLRAYHPETGELIDRLPVMEFAPEEYGGILQSFIEDSTLNLNIAKKAANNQEQDSTTNILISIHAGETLSLLHCSEGLLLGDMETASAYVDQMVEADQKLFVFTNITRENEKQGIPYEILWPRHYMMFVYQKDELIYKGELITDIDEDYIPDREKIASYNSGYGHNQYQFRQIYDIQVKEK
ncbi:MAG TPA: hypothetical protein GX505_12240 [Clostridiales bacterium]|nr:hypothetical protein [Clostridiales bacterium]